MTRSRSKHLPQRTCIACRQTKDKKELVRLVRDENGAVEVDTSGRKRGRGAYLCRQNLCWQLALKKNRLEYALRTKLSADDRQSLMEYARDLLEES
jgi:predicted RNA-binding protein YlxR (DUF448 family)